MTEHGHLYDSTQHTPQEFGGPKNRYDYSQFGLQPDWFNNDEEINKVIDSIKNGDMDIQKATDLYYMLDEQADMAIPDENEGASTNEVNDSAKLVTIATSIYKAIREKVPALEPLRRGEFPEVEEA